MNEKKERNEMYEKHQISQLDWERGGVYLNVFLCRVHCFTQFNDFWRLFPTLTHTITSKNKHNIFLKFTSNFLMLTRSSNVANHILYCLIMSCS